MAKNRVKIDDIDVQSVSDLTEDDLDRVSGGYQLFKADGKPLRARASVALHSITGAVIKIN